MSLQSRLEFDRGGESGKVMTGTGDAKVIDIPKTGLRPLICSIPSRWKGIVGCHHGPSDAREPSLYKPENCVIRKPAFTQDEIVEIPGLSHSKQCFILFYMHCEAVINKIANRLNTSAS